MSVELGPVTNNEASELRELVRSPALRRERNQYLIEGPHLIEAALEFAKREIVEIYATELARTEQTAILGYSGKRIRSISQKNAERVAETSTTQGIFALMDLPETDATMSAPLVLALDDVQDPGNVGTIIRTAAWFGVYDLIVTKATADLYSPKVLRATQGSIFNARAKQTDDLTRDLNQLKRAGYTIVATMLDERATPLSQLSANNKMVVVLGSEAHGVSANVAAIADHRIYIPKIGKGESLNVAISCGIVLERLTAISR